MRNSSTNIPIMLTIMLMALMACDKKDELPTEPPRPTTQTAPADLNDSSTKGNQSKGNQSKANPAGFNGFGPAKFGGNEEDIRMSWGRPLKATQPAKGMSCYYLYSDTMPHQRGVSFMLEDGRFVRYDVQDPRQPAPGNIVVGDSTSAIMQAYAGHVHNQPHKYIEGAHTLIVTPPEATNTRLIFETDAYDHVIEWRIGVPPQVYYVEGCG